MNYAIGVVHPDTDAGWVEIDTKTGEVIRHPGNQDHSSNQGGGDLGSISEDFKRAVLMMKTAVGIKDHELRKAAIRASGEYLAKNSLLDTPGGTILLVMDDNRIKPPVGGFGW
jgi:hypothetical protein